MPPRGWLSHLRHLCDEHSVLLIADEVLTGFGRTGFWFACEADAVEPDLVCCGKALGGGLPIAAVIGARQVFASWKSDGEALHTGTFVAHPVGCAAALATLGVLKSDRLPRRAARLGRRVAHVLADWPGRFDPVVEVRGRGLLWAVELQNASVAHRLTRAIAKRGLLALAGGPEGRVLQLVPPLAIAESQLNLALEIVASALDEI